MFTKFPGMIQVLHECNKLVNFQSYSIFFACKQRHIFNGPAIFAAINRSLVFYGAVSFLPIYDGQITNFGPNVTFSFAHSNGDFCGERKKKNMVKKQHAQNNRTK